MIKIALIEENKTTQELIKNFIQNISLENLELSFEEQFIFENFSQFENNKNENFDLIIFDINSKNQKEASCFIQKEKRKETKLIATSYEINSSLVTSSLALGADDFLIKPILKNILETSIKKVFKDKTQKNIELSKAISLFSSKGGVGKTSCIVNLGYEIQKITNKNVCILDLSQNCQNAAQYLDLKTMEQDFCFNILKNAKKEEILELLPKFPNSKLFVLALDFNFNSSLKLNQEKITFLINSLKNIFDWVLIDFESSMDEKLISILNSSNLIIYNTILNKPSIIASAKHFEMFSKTGYNKKQIKLLINRYTEDLSEQLKILEKEIDKSTDFKIPNNYLTIQDAINQMKPLDLTNPNSNIAKAYKEMAKKIISSDIQKNLDNNCTIFNILKRMGE